MGAGWREICGFAFDPPAGEGASTVGHLAVLRAQMNPDLAIGDESHTLIGFKTPLPS